MPSLCYVSLLSGKRSQCTQCCKDGTGERVSAGMGASASINQCLLNFVDSILVSICHQSSCGCVVFESDDAIISSHQVAVQSTQGSDYSVGDTGGFNNTTIDGVKGDEFITNCYLTGSNQVIQSTDVTGVIGNCIAVLADDVTTRESNSSLQSQDLGVLSIISGFIDCNGSRVAVNQKLNCVDEDGVCIVGKTQCAQSALDILRTSRQNSSI